MKCKIREICGDWALEIFQYSEPKKPTIVFFNSRQNALNIKRIIEVDDSIPNAATVCDMQEVVRCKNCRFYELAVYDGGTKNVCRLLRRQMQEDDFCSYGERKDEND